MNGNLQVDRDILIAGVTSAVSIIGICLVLFLGLRPNAEPATAPEPTVTPFRYALLATETYTAEPDLITEPPVVVLEGERNIPPAETAASTDPSETGTLSETSAATSETESSGTPPVDESQLMPIGKYDDTDLRIIYYGDWSSEFFVDGAYEESLYISTAPGNTVTFAFMGRQIVIGYMGTSDFELGLVTVAIDGTPFQMDQASGSSWTSPQLIFDEHYVVLTHQNGDTIFLDYVEIR